MDKIKNSGTHKESKEVTKEERAATIEKFDGRVEQIFENLKQETRRIVRDAFSGESPNNAQLEGVDVIVNMSQLMAKIVSMEYNEELFASFKTSTHIFTIEGQPVSTFADKAGMTYEEFKEAYPHMTTWIENNGWTYNEEQDQSLKKKDEGDVNNG